MAIIQPEDQQTLTGSPAQPQQNGNNKRHRQRGSRGRGKQNNNKSNENCGNTSDSSSSFSSSSSSDGSTRQPAKSRRRRNRGGKKAAKSPVTECEISEEEQAKYVAMDCEMVGVGAEGYRSALARVTLVDWQGEVVLDQYVKPSEPVTDYRTFVSGITEEDLDQATDIAACRALVTEALQDKILVGHGLKNDLAALGVRHPWFMTRDTAKWEPFMKVRFDDGILWPRKLKDLVQEKLKQEIQMPGRPHSPIEDAQAALDLYKLVRNKWEKAMVYKVNKTNEIMQQQMQQQQQ